MIITKEELLTALKAGQVCLTFEKKDHTIRVMNCTLQEDKVIAYEKKTSRVRKVNDEVVPVFDIDKQEWRSVRLESIQQVEIV